MLIYEIEASVPEDLIEKFEEYMRARHIPDLLSTGYFAAAEFARISPGNYRIRYPLEKSELLELYLETDAERLRRDFAEEFPDRIKISREILEVLQSWGKT